MKRHIVTGEVWAGLIVAMVILWALVSPSVIGSRDGAEVVAAPPVPGSAQVVVEGRLNAIGTYRELTLNTTIAQQLTVPAGAHLVWLQAGDNNIRYRLDGTDPTSSTGFVLAAGDYVLPPGNLSAMRFIAESGTAILRIQPVGL